MPLSSAHYSIAPPQTRRDVATDIKKHNIYECPNFEGMSSKEDMDEIIDNVV